MTIIFNPLGPPFDFTATTGASGPVNTLTGNVTTVNPSGNNINIVGLGLLSSGLSTAGNLYVSGAGSTLTVQETQAQFLTNYNETAGPTYVATATDYFISVDSTGAVTVELPNAPTDYRMFVVKDRTGHASVNNITVTTPGGITTFDGATSYDIDGDYESGNFVYHNGNYETY